MRRIEDCCLSNYYLLPCSISKNEEQSVLHSSIIVYGIVDPASLSYTLHTGWPHSKEQVMQSTVRRMIEDAQKQSHASANKSIR